MFNDFINFSMNLTLFSVIKGLLVVGLVMYTAFAVIIVRQVGVMSEAIDDVLNVVVKGIAWLHLLMAILLVGLTIVVL